MQCPSCGKPISFEDKFIKIQACEYCNTLLEFGQGEIYERGKQSEMIQFPSIFEVRKITPWQEKDVEVIGQIRYEYDGGFFNLFFASCQGKKYYIREDDGDIKFFRVQQFVGSEVDLQSAEVGKNIDIGKYNFFIQETGVYRITSLKGRIGHDILPGRTVYYINTYFDGKDIFFQQDIETKKITSFLEVKDI